ncbi:MAG TPA: hypothetical protein VK472_03680 [Allosphingosinicella sp.]|nr:hypothetical protein [Allosphingosinicella sp.]
MPSFTRFFGALSLALSAALLGAAPAAPARAAVTEAATQRTVTNVAEIEWDQPNPAARSARARLASNRVDIQVTLPPSTFSLTAYRFSSTLDALRLDVAAPICASTNGPVPAALAAGWQGVSLAPALMIPVEKIHPGEPFLFVLDYPAGNRDPGAVEQVSGAIVARSGDREVLTIFETGPDTGRFAGYTQPVRAPPPGYSGDCKLAVEPGDKILVESLKSGNQTPLVTAGIDVLVDPFGIVFDSTDAHPVSGARITLIDEANGQPALVFGDDGTSAYPSTVVAGETVTDAGGNVYTYGAGDYRFPLVRTGRYRLVVEAPSPYTAPSVKAANELAGLRRPDGQPFTIVPGSYGAAIELDNPAPVRIDIPLDPALTPIVLTKDASAAEADPGSLIQYRIGVRNPDQRLPTGKILVEDRFGNQMRLRAETVRVDGRRIAPMVGADGRSFRMELPALAPGAAARITYALEVRPDAAEGDAVNEANGRDDRDNVSNTVGATVRIRRDAISERMTIVGRVTEGGCSAGPAAKGLPGVRIMLEDGSYAVTDIEGRYHFEGVKPGTHVVQLDDMTLPADRAVAPCKADTRSAGRSFSRFVEGAGGSLKRVDFATVEAAPRAGRRAAVAPRAAPAGDAEAAGAERDWLAGQEPGIAWLFPETDHNARAPVVRVAIKHRPGQTVHLLSNGKPVDPVAFDGSRSDAAGAVSVSLWRGVPLENGATELVAEVRNADGTAAETLRRTLHWGAAPMHAELLRDKSLLVADGVSRPVIAVRFTDRDGRPVRHGTTGDFEIPAPYYPAVEADAQQARQLAGLERARPFWRVEGEQGLAYIELEPTTASGSVSLRFNFRDGDLGNEREQRVEAWLDPGDRPWTIVGLAEGTIGFNRLDSRLEALGDTNDEILTDGRLALYAKGRIQGKWLMTLAYDSDKQEDETRFGGTIDPKAYYTVYADRSERRYDAASVRRLYLKLERPQFYALFGDYETGIDEPQLARYVRSFNGVKAEYRSDRVSATAFAADAPTRHRRDELQGNGLTGPYALGARNVLANSERVAIEVRDRLRSDRIVESRILTRYVDYEIDYQAGTLRFREPILSRTSALDPQFIVVDYELDGVAGRSTNAGGRVALRTKDEKVQVGATAIHDSDDQGSTNLAGVDVRYRPSASTEVRAEVAVSDNETKAGAGAASGGTATAWQVEAEHHGSKVDLLAYAREREAGFGVGQTNAGENGTRKFGIDARARIGEAWSISASAWHEDYLGSAARRIAGRALVEYRDGSFAGRFGLVFADDQLADGSSARSTLLQLGATRKFLKNRLELDAQTEIPIGASESVDFPAKHRFGARYAINGDIQLAASYEIADGETVDARTARVGFDIRPWAGARIAISGNLQDIAEYGPRSFAAFGLSQSLVLDEHWSIDLTLDSNKTIDGIDPTRVLNPLHPVASGGYVGGGGISEDFTAITAGATYRDGPWSVTGRAEYRAGDDGDRTGFTAAALRQIGEGSALGGAFSFFAAEAKNGAETQATSLQLSWAHRPSGSRWTWLEKLELREDRVTGAVAGLPGPIGIPLTISGDARSRRMVNALSINYSPDAADEWGLSEISVFWGSRYVADRFGDDDISGWSNLLGADLRFDLSDKIDFGGAFTIRQGVGGRSFAYSGGPSFGITPFENGWVSLGWNLVGFHDRDFAEARYTNSGPYVNMRIKFDQTSLQGLGLGQ